MKTIFIGIPAYGGKVEVELALWMMSQVTRGFKLIVKPIRNLYIEQSRNLLVHYAGQDQADYLLMVDSDMEPGLNFLTHAVALLEHLHQQGSYSMVGAPYLASSVETTMWGARDGESYKITPDEASVRTGFEEVLNLGTGCLLIDMQLFSRLKKPYFQCIYDEEKEEIKRTEDVEFCNRARMEAGAHVFVAWDHWANHYKGHVLKRPLPPLYPLPPADVEGLKTDMGVVYGTAVKAAADGAHFVEVGCWKGASTILLAQLIQKSGKAIRLTVVDTFQGSPDEAYQQQVVAQHGGSIRAVFDANLRKHGVLDLVEVKQAGSLTASRAFAEGSLDFVYIDAGHSYEAVKQDILAWKPRVKPGGVLAGHDLDLPGVDRAVRELLPAARVVLPRSWIWQAPK